MINILLVDDHEKIRRLMEIYLRREGFVVHHAQDGKEALESLEHQHMDLLVVDIMMPSMDGYELVETMRKAGLTMPILMVTAKEAYLDKKKGFDTGIDDYMVKPVDMGELLLRVRALLRRAKIHAEKKIVMGEIELDYETLVVREGVVGQLLPKKEFYLLYKLLASPKKIFTRRDLLDEIWGLDSEVDERTVDVHIKRLREKFAHRPEFEIITVRGLGYKAERPI